MDKISEMKKQAADAEGKDSAESGAGGTRSSSILSKALGPSPKGLRAVASFFNEVFPSYQLCDELRMLAYIKCKQLKDCSS
jgi:hypothetical protein